VGLFEVVCDLFEGDEVLVVGAVEFLAAVDAGEFVALGQTLVVHADVLVEHLAVVFAEAAYLGQLYHPTKYNY